MVSRPPWGAAGPRLWACDRCVDRIPSHNGIHVLWSTGKVEFLRMEEIKGADLENGLITIGEGSEDPRLRTMRR